MYLSIESMVLTILEATVYSETPETTNAFVVKVFSTIDSYLLIVLSSLFNYLIDLSIINSSDSFC